MNRVSFPNMAYSPGASPAPKLSSGGPAEGSVGASSGVSSSGFPTGDAQTAAGQVFALHTPNDSLVATGVRDTLPAGTAATLGRRVKAFFDANEGGPELLVGAIPFSCRQNDYLVQPREITRQRPDTTPAALRSHGRWQVTSTPTRQGYADMVAEALRRISLTSLEKVVLARQLKVEADQLLDHAYVASRLARDPSVTAYAVPLPRAGGPLRTLVGGTPELLVAKRSNRVLSNPLAGSARRMADPQQDQAVSRQLSASEKNLREHAAVVECILDLLTPYCSQLVAPAGPSLQTTASMWHLGTQIEGTLKDDTVSAAGLAALLHPTPAVGGLPTAAALALIDELEPFDRSFYAGAVGWVDRQGDGEWYIALRCGEICERSIALYAGAGIVAGSHPEAEAQETSAKFLALLEALGIDEQGVPLEETQP